MNNASTYQKLLEENARLQEENANLQEEIRQLKDLLNIEKLPQETKTFQHLTLKEKVDLFRRTFLGREDVFARRWYSKSSGKSGYQPVCLNEWNRLLCDKKKYKCTACPNRQFKALNYEDVYKHLEGKSEDGSDVIGIYAILEDNKCCFLCADFDDKSCEHGYKNDVLAYVDICRDWNIPCYIERSRSGNGAHIWIFFEQPLESAKARKLGNAILTHAMERDGSLSFKSYDRLFPNQDQLPEGGFGNLVALPLQGQARKTGNSVFVDKTFTPYDDQWTYLQEMKRVPEKVIDALLTKYETTSELGELSTTTETNPWCTPTPQILAKGDFPQNVCIVRSNMLYVSLIGLSSKVVNHLKRIASFKNPEFYAKQRMRLSTYNIPRVISCAEVLETYLALPRGCEFALIEFMKENNVHYSIQDETQHGCSIYVKLKGKLHKEQCDAVQQLLLHHNGVLNGTTAFGKTVTAIGLIAKLKVNTLILVHTKALLDQWKSRLEEFLDIDYTEEVLVHKRGRKKAFSPFGTLDSNGNTIHGKIDIALIQSCFEKDNIKPFVRDYGMVIVDECHHVSAVNFERILKFTNASYVYGLTATPIRKDGHQPIIFMQCGPIRYSANAKEQMENQTFERLLIPRFTSYRDLSEEKVTYLQMTRKMAEDNLRNLLIANDVHKALEEGRSPIILTSLTEHVNTLASLLSAYCKNVITLIGAESAKEKQTKMELLHNLHREEPLIIVATGKYVGEGFDYPRLDTLFLALPISWKGLVAQYAGRLHREYLGKKEVRIYDYIDIHLPMCDAMYRRRLKGYASIGYKILEKVSNTLFGINQESIFSGINFQKPLLSDLSNAHHSIIFSTYL
jgi:superfamily II DNA or RNA helicase